MISTDALNQKYFHKTNSKNVFLLFLLLVLEGFCVFHIRIQKRRSARFLDSPQFLSQPQTTTPIYISLYQAAHLPGNACSPVVFLQKTHRTGRLEVLSYTSSMGVGHDIVKGKAAAPGGCGRRISQAVLTENLKKTINFAHCLHEMLQQKTKIHIVYARRRGRFTFRFWTRTRPSSKNRKMRAASTSKSTVTAALLLFLKLKTYLQSQHYLNIFLFLKTLSICRHGSGEFFVAKHPSKTRVRLHETIQILYNDAPSGGCCGC